MNASLSDRAAKPRADTTACHERAVHRVIAAMHERLDEDLPLRTMAEVAIMSPFHFNRTFHNVTGLPPGHFLTALRLERARNLLVTTQQRVTDVCFDVGYNSLGTFTRRFTETFGVSPRRLRAFAAAPSPPLPAPVERPSRTQAHPGGSISGSLTVPPDFSGGVFIGLFRSPLPCGAPVACKVLSGPGGFTFSAPAGRYYLYAVGIRQPASPMDMLVFDDAPRASGGAIEVCSSLTASPVDVVLRPRAEIDPPILVTLPLLLAKRRLPAHGIASRVRPRAVA